MSGIDYPLDLWFLVSDHIKPEAVGKFASICKSSYYVTTTAKFWFHMYKRFYLPLRYLPQRLEPQSMTSRHCLRACVVRMLHFAYFPRIRNIDRFSQSEDPHSLVGRRCCAMWQSMTNKGHYIFFKLKKKSGIERQLLTPKPDNCKESFLQVSENVLENPEENCKILQIMCSGYMHLPAVMGSILQTVSLTLAPGLKLHRLKLAFGSSQHTDTLSTRIMINDVVQYDVLNWWHHDYDYVYPVPTFMLNTKALRDCWETMEDNDDST